MPEKEIEVMGLMSPAQAREKLELVGYTEDRWPTIMGIKSAEKTGSHETRALITIAMGSDPQDLSIVYNQMRAEDDLPNAEQANHLEAYYEGGFFVIEWSDDEADLETIINENIEDGEWIERIGSKEKFLKVFVAENNGVFKIWISTDKDKKHNLLFFSLPSEEIKNIVASGELIQYQMNFIVSAPTLYESMILDRDLAIAWMDENLPNWV